MEQERSIQGPVVLSGLVVLVVDDDHDNLRLLERILARRGATVVTAECAAGGLAALKERCPDVVLSDLQMEGGDGFGFMQCVRSSEHEHLRFVPAIAMTSLSGDQHRRRAREAGFWRFLVKPLDASVVCEEVAKLAHMHRRFVRPKEGMTG
jgi:chemosensory pili system protein ChpA (sensor histidine kinase/response regulator)